MLKWFGRKHNGKPDDFAKRSGCLKRLAKASTEKEISEELRETLLAELVAHPERAAVVLPDLKPLLDTAAHRIRGWQQLAEAEQQSGHSLVALDDWLELLEENPTGYATRPDDPALETAFSRFVQGAIADLFESAKPNVKTQLATRLQAERDKALNSRDPFAVSRFARRFDQLKWGRELLLEEHSRSRIGQSVLEQQLGLQAIAEVEGDRTLQALALKRLAEDRISELRFREAAFFHRQLRERFAEVQFSEGQTVSAYLDSVPKDSPARKFWDGAPRWPLATPRISEQSAKGKLPMLFRLPVSAPPGSLCAELDVWLDPNRRRLRFAGGGQKGAWELAFPGKDLTLDFNALLFRCWGVGPVLIFGGGTDLLGIAPLDDHGEPHARVLWRVRMAGPKKPDENDGDHSIQYRLRQPPIGFGVPHLELHDAFAQTLDHVGPVTAGFLVYQGEGRLTAIEPATGKKLWSRSQLPLHAAHHGRCRVCRGDSRRSVGSYGAKGNGWPRVRPPGFARSRQVVGLVGHEGFVSGRLAKSRRVFAMGCRDRSPALVRRKTAQHHRHSFG